MSTGSEPDAALETGPLPIIDILFLAVESLVDSLPAVCGLAIVPAAVALLVGSGVLSIPTEWLPDDRSASVLLELVPDLLFALISLPFAVGCHRLLLLGESPSRWSALRFDRRVVAFGIGSLLVLAPLLPATASQLFGHSALITLPIVLTGAYISSRLSLVLPSVAVGDDRSLGEIWALGKFSGWRIFWVHALVGIAPGLILGFGLEALARLLPDALVVAGLTIAGVVSVLSVTAIEVFALSIIYRHLAAPPPREASEGTAR